MKSNFSVNIFKYKIQNVYPYKNISYLLNAVESVSFLCYLLSNTAYPL